MSLKQFKKIKLTVASGNSPMSYKICKIKKLFLPYNACIISPLVLWSYKTSLSLNANATAAYFLSMQLQHTYVVLVIFIDSSSHISLEAIK